MNIKGTTIKRRIPIAIINAVSISAKSNEFIVHAQAEYDYRLASPEHRFLFIDSIFDAKLSPHQDDSNTFPLNVFKASNLSKFVRTKYD